MLAIVRVKMRNGNDGLWNYIYDNKQELEKQFNNCVELMYMTKRAKHEDTSLFIHAEDPNCFGEFVAKVITHIPGVEGIWMFNMMNMKFFYLQENLLDEWTRYIVTINTHPSRVEDVYKALSNLNSNSDIAPVYLAYTFHLFGDNIMFSLLANDTQAAQKFTMKNIKDLPGVLRTNVTAIEKQERLTSRESWKLYVKSNLLPKA